MPLFSEVMVPPEFSGQSPTTVLRAGEAYNFDARYAINVITVTCDSDATATLQRILDLSQTAAITGSPVINCNTNVVTDTALDWPFYRAEVTGTDVVTQADGDKTADKDVFTSTLAQFVTNGVVAGDALTISSGTEQGTYFIKTVISETAVAFLEPFTVTENTLSFTVAQGSVTVAIV